MGRALAGNRRSYIIPFIHPTDFHVSLRCRRIKVFNFFNIGLVSFGLVGLV